MQIQRAGFLLACFTAVGVTAYAGAVTMTFEGLQDQEAINNYYNGGFGGNGSGPGPNYGVQFSGDSLALIEAAKGGTGNFFNPPSGDTGMFFLSGSGDVMNVAAGFTTGFSFYYSSPFYAGTVDVYSGLNGTGTLLASLNLATTPDGAGIQGCDGYHYCPFVAAGATFAGTAESVNFSGVANYIVFDNVTIGSGTPSAPEPSTFFLISAGLGLAGLVARRRRFSNSGSLPS